VLKKKFFLISSCLSLSPRALSKPKAPRPLMMRNQGSHALQTTPMGHLVWCRDRAGRPHSPYAMIGWG